MRDITYKASAEKTEEAETNTETLPTRQVDKSETEEAEPNTEGATDTQVHKTEADAETEAEAKVVYITGLSILSCLASIFKTLT
jgi:hypothetical protein